MLSTKQGKGSSQPTLYQVVIDDILESIQSGAFSFDHPICTESKLMDKYSISRITARRAMTEPGLSARMRDLGGAGQMEGLVAESAALVAEHVPRRSQRAVGVHHDDRKTAAAYVEPLVSERHRHRFEVNNSFRQRLAEAGLTTREALGYLRALAGLRFSGFDVVEVSPPYDGPGQPTAVAAANVAYELLTLAALA